MKKILFFVSCLFVISVQAMEGEDKYTATPAEPFNSSVLWNTLPVELVKSMQSDINENKTVYTVGGSKLWLMSYALRKIDPVNLTNVNRTDVDLIPTVEKPILLDLQFWPSQTSLLIKSRLCLDSANTEDTFNLHRVKIDNGVMVFDGINNNRLALVAKTGKNTNDRKEGLHCLYVLHQSRDNTGSVELETIWPALFEKGELAAILLHRESNRCVRGIKDVDKESNLPHCITIGDICNATAEDNNAYVNTTIPVRIAYDGTMLSREDKCITVASLATDFVLRKAIYVGKDTYLGLTEEGNFVVFWLNAENKIEYAHQDCHGKRFKDLDVDETIKTKSGFMPRIALLANNGEVFLTDLRMGQENKVLLYSCTLKNPDNIFRFFYDKEQCAVVYKKAGAYCGNIYDTFHVWPDNFNLLLAYASLKASQQRMSKEEK